MRAAYKYARISSRLELSGGRGPAPHISAFLAAVKPNRFCSQSEEPRVPGTFTNFHYNQRSQYGGAGRSVVTRPAELLVTVTQTGPMLSLRTIMRIMKLLAGPGSPVGSSLQPRQPPTHPVMCSKIKSEIVGLKQAGGVTRPEDSRLTA